MIKLEESEHSYYCECWEGSNTSEYNNWKDFTDNGKYDLDYNLLFRFDICKEEDQSDKYFNTYTLYLHHALQRHGTSQWHVVIHNIEEEDLEEIEIFLEKAKKHLFNMWEEIE